MRKRKSPNFILRRPKVLGIEVKSLGLSCLLGLFLANIFDQDRYAIFYSGGSLIVMALIKFVIPKGFFHFVLKSKKSVKALP